MVGERRMRKAALRVWPTKPSDLKEAVIKRDLIL
jgi:hypothetical protein